MPPKILKSYFFIILVANLYGVAPGLSKWCLRVQSIGSLKRHATRFSDRKYETKGLSSLSTGNGDKIFSKTFSVVDVNISESIIHQLLVKDEYSGEHISKVNDVLVVDVPGRWIGRRIFPFRITSDFQKGRTRVILHSIDQSGGIFVRTQFCRFMITGRVCDDIFRLDMWRTVQGIPAQQIDRISEELFKLFSSRLGNQIRVLTAHKRLLETRRQLDVEAEKERVMSSLESKSGSRTRIRPGGAKFSDSGARYKRSSDMSLKRNPKRG
jgi:hypothetical protein